MQGDTDSDIAGTGDRVGKIDAAATMIVVSGGFVDPDMLVEIEMDAVQVA